MEDKISTKVELDKVLIEYTIISIEDADTLSHALVDIWSSTNKVYNDILPKLFVEKDSEKIIELIWDIQEEFRHIDYHMNDAKLTEIHYVKKK